MHNAKALETRRRGGCRNFNCFIAQEFSRTTSIKLILPGPHKFYATAYIAMNNQAKFSPKIPKKQRMAMKTWIEKKKKKTVNDFCPICPWWFPLFNNPMNIRERSYVYKIEVCSQWFTLKKRTSGSNYREWLTRWSRGLQRSLSFRNYTCNLDIVDGRAYTLGMLFLELNRNVRAVCTWKFFLLRNFARHLREYADLGSIDMIDSPTLCSLVRWTIYQAIKWTKI